jgi:hypothetical protein
MTPHPDEAFMTQCARQLTDPFDGFLLDKRYLIHDRDTTFTAAFDQYVCDQGVEPLVLPPQSPNLNAHGERFIRSIKEEPLDRMIFLIMDFVRDHCSMTTIADELGLSEAQVQAALDYIAANRSEVEAECDRLLLRLQQGNPPHIQAGRAESLDELKG